MYVCICCFLPRCLSASLAPRLKSAPTESKRLYRVRVLRKPHPKAASKQGEGPRGDTKGEQQRGEEKQNRESRSALRAPQQSTAEAPQRSPGSDGDLPEAIRGATTNSQGREQGRSKPTPCPRRARRRRKRRAARSTTDQEGGKASWQGQRPTVECRRRAKINKNEQHEKDRNR